MAKKDKGASKFAKRFRKDKGKVESAVAAVTEADEAKRNAQIQDAALQYIARRIPTDLRQQFPMGQFDVEARPDRHHLYKVQLQHLDGDIISYNHYADANVSTKEIGDAIGIGLSREIERWARHNRRYEAPKATRKEPGQPITYVATVEDALPAAAKEDIHQAYGVGKAGPICLICGPEDREEFPSWGDCPHSKES